jgi:hypothetical protein
MREINRGRRQLPISATNNPYPALPGAEQFPFRKCFSEGEVMSKTQKKKKAAANTLINERSFETVSTRTTQTNADAVAAKAYELFLARGCTDGHALDDWIEAEKQLQQASEHSRT